MKAPLFLSYFVNKFTTPMLVTLLADIMNSHLLVLVSPCKYRNTETMEEDKLVKQGRISFVESPELMSSAVCSSSPWMQHDTCPVCRKSLNGEDSSSQPPSESPSLSMDPRTQERWSF